METVFALALNAAADNKIFDGMTHVHTWWDNVSTQRWGTNHNHGRIFSIIESDINVSQWMILDQRSWRVTQNCQSALAQMC